MRKSLLSFFVLFPMLALPVLAQRAIQGNVRDAASGTPLPGVTVLLKGTNIGTATGPDGHYSLDIPGNNGVIVFSYIGYTSQEVPVDDQQTINVQLSQTTENLESVVVTGYGTQVKRDLTSSVASVSSSEIEDITLPNISNALQGRVAGVQMTGTSGVLGTPVNVHIRGASSITASSQPLYVVDGMPIINQPLGAALGADSPGGISSLLNLNPDDIASIQVLKDASASALYGSRGANGVILITTKKGHTGQTRVSVGVTGGFTQPTKKYDLLNGLQFAKMMNYAFGALIGSQDPQDIASIEKLYIGEYLDPAKVPNTDWTKLVTQTGYLMHYQAGVSGGDKNTQYYLSGHYKDEQGYIHRNEIRSYNALLNLDQQVNDRLHVHLSISPSYTDDRRIAISNAVAAPYTQAALEPPVISAYDSTGALNDGVIPIPFNSWSAFAGTPLSNRLDVSFHSVATQINTHGVVTYQLIPQHLSIETQLSVQQLQLKEREKQGEKTTDGYPNGAGFASNDQFLNYSWNNVADYTNQWGDHSLEVKAAVTFQRVKEEYFEVDANNFASDRFKTLQSASQLTFGTGYINSYAFQNNILRINYAFKDRYLLSLTGSLNGSSRFGKNNQYGIFPAVSAGWIISDENFMRDITWLNFLKVRASYGITGNAALLQTDGTPFNYPSLGLVGTGADYNDTPGLHPTQLPNPDLKWEKTAQLDVGADFHVIGSRLRGTFDFYDKQTSDLLLNVPIPATNGYTTYVRNIGKLENYGIEVGMEGDIITGADLRWSLNANFSTLHNEVLSLPGHVDISQGENLIREGQPIGVFYLREYAGVNSANGDALYYLNAKPTQAQLGSGSVFQVKDKFGDRYVTANYNLAQRIIAGSPFGKWYGGFGTSVFFKGLQLDVNFQYNYGNKIYWQDGTFLETNMGSLFNQDKTQLDYWTPQNKNASVPEPRALTANGSDPSTRYLLDGSYLRLKTVVLSYTLPKSLTQGYDVRVYAQGYNLLTFTKFKGLDPEVTANITDAIQGNVFFQPPQQRTVTLGVKLGF